MTKPLQNAADIEEKVPRPHPTIEVEKASVLSGIEGQVLDAFNREGHKEVERRVALQYNNFPIRKERVMLLGDVAARDLFLDNIFGNGERQEVRKFRGIGCFDVEKPELRAKVFSNEYLSKQLARMVDKSLATGDPITTIVNCWPDGEHRHLKWFAEMCPTVQVFNILYADPTGQGRVFAPRFGSDDLWDTQSVFEKEADLPWVIEHIAHVGESTWFGALPKQMKTWVMLCVVKALLTGEPLFGDERFKVSEAKLVIYLIPEASRPSVKKRLKLLGLLEHLYDPITNPNGGLFVRTLSAGEKIKLNDARLLAMVKDADVFLDTAIRWLEGEENKSSDVAVLSENIFNIIAAGARSVWCAHHAPKGFADASTMTLENMFRGSGEYGAALSNAYGLCQTDEKTSTLHFHAIVGRDLDELIPDMTLQGRPYLSTIRNFKVVDANAEPFSGVGKKTGRPEDPDKQLKIDFARSVAGSLQDKVEAVNKKFGSNHSKSTIREWLKDFDVDHEKENSNAETK
jgi:hypothetical protein